MVKRSEYSAGFKRWAVELVGAAEVSTSQIGIVNLRLSEPHDRSAVSSLYYQATIWAHVTSCHSQNALARNSR